MTDIATGPVVVSNSRILRCAIGVIAFIELAFSSPALPLLLDPSPLTAQGVTGWLILGNIFVTPVLALLALVFAILGRLRNAVIAIGTLVLTGWINTAIAATSFGLNFDEATALDNATTIFQTFIAPIVATLAIALASLRHHIALSVILVSLPTLVNMLVIAALAVGVAGNPGG
jgi:hypothetical protein